MFTDHCVRVIEAVITFATTLKEANSCHHKLTCIEIAYISICLYANMQVSSGNKATWIYGASGSRGLDTGLQLYQNHYSFSDVENILDIALTIRT